MFDLSVLNKEQREAGEATEGAVLVLVLAGAGTGKTKVLTSRIAYIVQQGLCGINEILAVTFTNKAAKEMKERALGLLDNCPALDIGNLWIGTFHSLDLRMIRPFHEKFKRTSNFSIIDEWDQTTISHRLSL